MVYADNPYLA